MLPCLLVDIARALQCGTLELLLLGDDGLIELEPDRIRPKVEERQVTVVLDEEEDDSPKCEEGRDPALPKAEEVP